jgi:prolyl-tRNA synthetase
MYQFKDRSGREIGLATTHEEPLTEIALRSVSSYKDLPFFVYQIQTKFRDELRAKSGLLRGREFIMKDMYSFHRDKSDLDKFYSKTIDRAYKNIFKQCGLTAYLAEAAGGTFTKDFTHEYQVLSEAGEDTIYYCGKCGYAQNKEIAALKESAPCPKCRGEVKKGRSIEVGNIFPLGTKYSEAVGLSYQDADGSKKPVVMGSYGIGVGRLMATVVEIFHDERGIIWPESLAPFRVHLIEIKGSAKVKKAAENLYKILLAKDIEVLYDERADKSPGEKFADADLIGIPWRVVISEKTLAGKGIEVKRRSDKESKIVSEKNFLGFLGEK